ncbi:MAG: ABC transporter ATP-binding protein [bacterium]
MSDSVLEMKGLTKQYGSDQALRNFNLDLCKNEILTLIGPSGCGKTTALRVVAGLEEPDEGAVVLRDQTVTGGGTVVAPEQRDVGFVFQDLALFPHMTVAENVAFGLPNDASDVTSQVNDILGFVGLGAFRNRYPEDLSGGQKQRVALARSLVTQPSVLLMDEPFTNLDKGLREQLRKDMREILKESGIPTLFVTHDQEEAIFLGDRTAVMNNGTVEQVSKPEDVVIHPESRFVAEFLGPTEFLPAQRTTEGIETEVQTIPENMVETPNQKDFDLMVRADDILVETAKNGNADGIVEDAEFLGGLFRYKIRLESGRCVYSLLNHSEQISPDTPVHVRLDPGHKLVGFEKSN